MKLLILSDLQGLNYNDWITFLKINQRSFDIIVLLGDIDTMFLKTISEVFSKKTIFGVLGNHDYIGDLEYYNLRNIHGRTLKINNYVFWGLEGSYKYKDNKDSPLYSQEEIIEICLNAKKADIIISHNSPKGIHDKPDLPHSGFKGLIKYIEEHNPKYCIHGHQHIDVSTKHNETTIIGVYGGAILDTETGEIKKVLNNEC